MTPQAFSYATVSKNGMIYIPPYGLTECVDYMLKIDPATFQITKLPIQKSDKTERWTYGVEVDQWIYFFPYNETYILAVNTDTDAIEHIHLMWPENTKQVKGKFISFQLYENKIISLPYGESEQFDYVLVYDIITRQDTFVKIDCEINDCKKWHTSQLLGDKIHAVPRGERWESNYFPYAVEFDCASLTYNLENMSDIWKEVDQQGYSNKKYTTLAKSNGKLYAPPYSENPNFETLLMYKNGQWNHYSTGLTKTSRKYYSHTVAKNGKIYFPPAGHDEDWSELLIIDTVSDQWHTVELGIGKESKKYFAGVENSQGKIYYMPRGGCACMPTESWKEFGDLVEVLVIDTKDNSHYTVDVSKFFLDNTTIEKYNCCVIKDDIIYAFPYGESKTFHTLLIFDTILEQVIKTIDLNDI
jgi:hypothetical protein